MEKILIVDDEKSIRFTFKNFLLDAGYEVCTAKNYDEAIEEIFAKDFDVVFADIVLGGKTGVDLLRVMRDRNINCPVIMITGYPNIETASEAVRLGAFDYIEKPVHKKTLLHTARKALDHKHIKAQNRRYRSHLEAIFRSVKDGIITIDKELQIMEINDAAKKILGFSGDLTGKPLETLLEDFDDHDWVERAKKTLEEEKGSEIYRLEWSFKNRPSRVVTISFNPLIGECGVLMVIRDETPLARLEETLEERRKFHNITGKSKKMQKLYSLLEKLSSVPTTVLITGESGTGKELVAEALHHKSPRKNNPFVKINCSALPENLLESELFGHVKGAFTGAIKDKTGRFQKAHRGTIFLDEIGDITPALQLRLLRVLQEKEFERVGDSNPVKVDVRILAATNKSLQEKVKEGTFREDLYYRLKVVELNLPPLREKREDIPLLVEHLIEKLNKELGKSITSVSRDVQKIFLNYPWPGNIRELENTIEYALILAEGSIITLDDLPSDIRNFKVKYSKSHKKEGVVKRKRKSSEIEDEAKVIKEALEKCNWKKAKAARLLGVSRKTVQRKVKEYNISKGSL